jgi:hypothetical protein
LLHENRELLAGASHPAEALGQCDSQPAELGELLSVGTVETRLGAGEAPLLRRLVVGRDEFRRTIAHINCASERLKSTRVCPQSPSLRALTPR